MNVLVDFFSLFQFDVLIRSQSNFSLIPSLLHDFALVYSPTAYSRNGEEIVIEKWEVALHEEVYQKLLREKS